ncbi:type II toxin-antitoxin system RelE/ParE family toxin [Sulfurimonas sp. SAG-AH-194-C20]|nr:type II toxin-antitoxin system RelE/ParE family toxin [Sulfurimonas sp. SAG-AH-194-C20]MDF1879197.1 type II toxin-antitoxin system RelE/ParE family toxin [Sulfurimonas sp. SAG-AH-194-C20]
MIYSIVVKEDAKKDLKEFDRSQQILIVKQFHKIAKSPELGGLLGNKNGYDLSGCRKMYADGKKIRIVYKIVEEKIIIEVVALGKRDEMEVYKKASQRV